MSFLNRFLLATFVGIVLAVGVHIAAILTAPRYAEQDAFGRIPQTVAGGHAQIISAPGGQNTWLPMPDPAAAVAVCPFNLNEGPARIEAKTGALFLSFSFHTKTGGVFFAVTDRAAVRGDLEIVLMTARQLDEARAGEDESEPSRDVRIVAPESRGYMIVRVVAPTPSLYAQARQAAEAVSCTVDEEI